MYSPHGAPLGPPPRRTQPTTSQPSGSTNGTRIYSMELVPPAPGSNFSQMASLYLFVWDNRMLILRLKFAADMSRMGVLAMLSIVNYSVDTIASSVSALNVSSSHGEVSGSPVTQSYPRDKSFDNPQGDAGHYHDGQNKFSLDPTRFRPTLHQAAVFTPIFRGSMHPGTTPAQASSLRRAPESVGQHVAHTGGQNATPEQGATRSRSHHYPTADAQERPGRETDHKFLRRAGPTPSDNRPQPAPRGSDRAPRASHRASSQAPAAAPSGARFGRRAPDSMLNFFNRILPHRRSSSNDRDHERSGTGHRSGSVSRAQEGISRPFRLPASRTPDAVPANARGVRDGRDYERSGTGHRSSSVPPRDAVEVRGRRQSLETHERSDIHHRSGSVLRGYEGHSGRAPPPGAPPTDVAGTRDSSHRRHDTRHYYEPSGTGRHSGSKSQRVPPEDTPEVRGSPQSDTRGCSYYERRPDTRHSSGDVLAGQRRGGYGGDSRLDLQPTSAIPPGAASSRDVSNMVRENQHQNTSKPHHIQSPVLRGEPVPQHAEFTLLPEGVLNQPSLHAYMLICAFPQPSSIDPKDLNRYADRVMLGRDKKPGERRMHLIFDTGSTDLWFRGSWGGHLLTAVKPSDLHKHMSFHQLVSSAGTRPGNRAAIHESLQNHAHPPGTLDRVPHVKYGVAIYGLDYSRSRCARLRNASNIRSTIRKLLLGDMTGYGLWVYIDMFYNERTQCGEKGIISVNGFPHLVGNDFWSDMIPRCPRFPEYGWVFQVISIRILWKRNGHHRAQSPTELLSLEDCRHGISVLFDTGSALSYLPRSVSECLRKFWGTSSANSDLPRFPQSEELDNTRSSPETLARARETLEKFSRTGPYRIPKEHTLDPECVEITFRGPSGGQPIRVRGPAFPFLAMDPKPEDNRTPRQGVLLPHPYPHHGIFIFGLDF
ncbi:uncharacterized protein BXZ73DRAFT_80477 [Epithele typhae]|uniref:uncharacterized protein n=1 Tax=Epithele typhae TaxID=378194 RepID=UPI002007F7A9|nr:uncharacterized protein BXZ73DRAFT_80477 [Epithele typhae]KAH9918941.1 hypothetical protein BXZ73DRAFT_80477 [Epithele typhae]